LLIDFQDVSNKCEHCGADFVVTRGSVYRDGVGVSIYLAALHQCDNGEVVHLAIAVQQGKEGFDETCAVALQLRCNDVELGFSVVDWDRSPWKDEAYLGRQISRDDLLMSDKRDTFFHIADHIVIQNPTIKKYFSLP